MNRIHDKKRWWAANFCTPHIKAADNSLDVLFPLGLAFALAFAVLAAVTILPHVVAGVSAAAGVAGGASLALAPLSSRPKKLGTLAFASGGGDKLTGTNLGLYRFKSFILVFTATFNKAGAAAFGTLASEAPFNLFRDIRVNGRSLLQKAGARWMRQLNHRYLGKTDASFTAPTATNSNQTIQFTLYIDGESKRTNFPDGSLIDLSKNVGNPSFEVDFGTVEDLIAGGDYTTKTITGATVTVYGVIDEQAQLSRFQFSDRELKYIEKSISASAQLEYPIDLPLQRSITRILCGQFTASPEVLLANTLVTTSANVRVDVNGKPIWGPFTLQEINRWNLQDTNGNGLDSGYFVIDFLRHSNHLKDWLDLTKTLNTSDPDRVTSAQLIVDVASVSNARLGVLVDSLVPPFLQKAA
jgi:hypothetical protein